MKKPKVVLRCSLCGREHPGEDVKPGWYGEYKTLKMAHLRRVICPACPQRIGVKGDQN